MIVCPNCNHQNPEGATQCEACYTPLPVTTSCPQCGATVQTDASFCGQCGFGLQGNGDPFGATGQPDFPDLEPTPDLPEVPFPSSPEEPATEVSEAIAPASTPSSTATSSTQLQVENASLLHVQTNSVLELPQNLPIIHLGKPGGPVPPDIDVSGFPDSAIVSRVHADIRVEGGIYYLEDVGSSNGTYVNHNPLVQGNRHRLRAGDRIALGKEDKVTFIFQLSS
ncbi:FHA domain-containing protein [Spirulina subsalsa]|uniref:FHA domain-containing protein n=1 Tax=Spirulina subsalsa TaxID=54311 RepID=UPI0002EB2054|nr:FHA domain-containing protein [Spirulina subsalsa]